MTRCGSTHVCCALAIAAAMLAAAPVLHADSPLVEAKALYAAASYEAALAALEKAEDGELAPEALQYRTLCLLALGRTADAQRAAAALVTAAPLLVPSEEEFPPRFVALIVETRKTLLPAIARRLFAEGRDQFHGPNKTDAIAPFERVLALTDDPAVDAAEVRDLRTLALGYLDLLRAQPQAPAPRPAAQAAARTPSIVPAVPIRQTLPSWVAPRSAMSARELNGAVRLVIGTDGKVKSARMIQPTHPAYDALVLQAARDWTYTPATMNGAPVESERVLDIHVNRP